MNKKTVIMLFTLGVLVVPGLRAAENPLDQYMVVTIATHSDYVTLAEPSMDDAKDCAQHLGELLMEGLYVDDTNIHMSSLEVEEVVRDAINPVYKSIFHLSNNSIWHPKTAIIVCTRYAADKI